MLKSAVRDSDLDSDLTGKINYMNDVIEQLDQPFIVSFTGIPSINLEKKSHSAEVYGVQEYLLSLANVEDKPGAGYEKLDEITDEDLMFKKDRNEGLQYVAYRKFTLKPSIQEQAKKRFTAVVDDLESEFTRRNKEKEGRIAEKEKEKDMYSMGIVYKELIARGGEDGQDGFLDVDIVNNETGSTIRFVAKDVFDFGVVNFPKRVGGSDLALKRDLWEKEEILMSKWLSDFGPFKGIRM